MKQYIETPRLILRDWKEEDVEPFARINSDEQVMEYFLKRLDEKETLAFYRRIVDEFADCGFGLYAVEDKWRMGLLSVMSGSIISISMLILLPGWKSAGG